MEFELDYREPFERTPWEFHTIGEAQREVLADFFEVDPQERKARRVVAPQLTRTRQGIERKLRSHPARAPFRLIWFP